MRQVLMVFAWIGLAGGIAMGVFLLAFGPPKPVTLIPAAAYVLGGVFWFALCSVLSETLVQVEELRAEVKQLRA